MSATAFQRMRREQAAKREAEEAQKHDAKALKQKTVPELKEMAKETGIEGFDNMKKDLLIEALLKAAEEPQKEPEKEPEGGNPDKEPNEE